MEDTSSPTEGPINIGDSIAWNRVPSGALVKGWKGDYARRLGNTGRWVYCGPRSYLGPRSWSLDNWDFEWDLWGELAPVTVAALGLTGNEDVAELQILAEGDTVIEWKDIPPGSLSHDGCGHWLMRWPQPNAEGKDLSWFAVEAGEGSNAALEPDYAFDPQKPFPREMLTVGLFFQGLTADEINEFLQLPFERTQVPVRLARFLAMKRA